MGETTAISWCDHTWNPWVGCTKVSPACDGCYAEHLMDRRMGRVTWGGPGRGRGTRSRTSEHTWNDPFRWQRKAEKDGTRPFVFCASLADIFDNAVPPEWRREAFDVMRRTPRLVYLLLTKRPQNIARLTEEAGGLPSNCALGTTVEDQKRANINVPTLVLSGLDPLFYFVSCEPLLGKVELNNINPPGSGIAGSNFFWRTTLRPRIGWVITGGETDQGAHKARPSHPDWFRALRDQCAVDGVPFHHKQNGEWKDGSDFATDDSVRAVLTDGRVLLPDMESFRTADRENPVMRHSPTLMRRIGKARAGRTLDGVLHDARPERTAP
ncbi:DUF5131 family protein [Xanthobacter sediminis]